MSKKYHTLNVNVTPRRSTKQGRDVKKRDSSKLKYSLSTHVEILRSSGKWQKGTVSKIDFKEKCYFVQFDAPGGKVSEKGVNFSDEKKYMRASKASKRRTSQKTPTLERTLSQLTVLKSNLEEELAGLTPKLKESVDTKDFITAGKIQAKIDAKNAKLTVVQDNIERTKKEQAAKEQAVKERAAQERALIEQAAKERIAKELAAEKAKKQSICIVRSDGKKSLAQLTEIKLSLEVERNQLKSKLEDAISKKDFNSANSLQEDINAVEAKITKAQSDLEIAQEEIAQEKAAKELLQEQLKENVAQMAGIVRSLEAECDVIKKKLDEVINNKDFLSAGKISKELEIKQEELANSQKELKSEEKKILSIPLIVEEEVKGDPVELSQTVVSLERECGLLEQQFNKAFIEKDFVNAEKIKTECDIKNAKLIATLRGLQSSQEALLIILESMDETSKKHLTELATTVRSLQDECDLLKPKFNDALSQKDCVSGKIIWEQLETKRTKLDDAQEKLRSAKDILREKPANLNGEPFHIESYLIKMKLQKLQLDQKEKEEEELRQKKELEEKTRKLQEEVDKLRKNSLKAMVYSVGDRVEVKRGNGRWVQCEIRSIDREEQFYRCEYGDSFKQVPFDSSSKLLRPLKEGQLPQMFSVNEHIEVKRRSGAWTHAKITKIEDSKYRCDYNGIFKLIPFQDASENIRKIQHGSSAKKKQSISSRHINPLLRMSSDEPLQGRSQTRNVVYPGMSTKTMGVLLQRNISR